MMSVKVTFSRFCRRKATRASKCWVLPDAMAGSLSGSALEGRPSSSPSIGFACRTNRPRVFALLGEHGLDLGLQRLRVERLDDVVVHAGLLGGDHVLGLRLGGDHDERRLGEPGILADLLEQLVAR